MDKKILDKLIVAIIKSNDKNVIYKALVKLRVDLVKDKAGIIQFTEAGGVAPLVRLLSKPYEKILEVALSILGNCCTRKECCKQILTHGALPTLLTILKSIPNVRVQCRVCRLLGNLARESNEKLCSLAKGIGITLSSVLEDSKDTATLTMAIRAVRMLWNEMTLYEEFIRYDGVNRILEIMLLNTMTKSSIEIGKSVVDTNAQEQDRVEFMEKYITAMEKINSTVFDQEISKKIRPTVDAFAIPDKNDKHELFVEILKCLETVTNMSSYKIIYNFYENKHSCSCISFFASSESPFRSQALKILSNLSKSYGNSVLNDSDVVTAACSLITNSNLSTRLNESEERHCVNIICFLANDSCNRAKIRKSGAFKRLLELAKNTKRDSTLTTILIGLQHFRYDNMSIDLMIRMGLVRTLMRLLELKTKDLNEPHDKDAILAQKDVKRSYDDEDGDENSEEKTKRCKIDFHSPAFLPRGLCSPRPNSSPSSSTSSHGMSPSTRADYYDDIEDYSPVVSDIEDQEDANDGGETSRTDGVDILQQILNEQTTPRCDIEDENLVGDLDADPEEEEIEKDSADVSEKKKTIQLILDILGSASYRIKQAKFELSLCSDEILDTLIRACRVAHKRRHKDTPWDALGAPLLLSHIVSETKNFMPLLKRDFIYKIYDLANPIVQHDRCSLCQELKLIGSSLLDLLNKVAETGYGTGEMTNMLLQDDKEISKRVSIISALIIRDPKILNLLLLQHGGLYTITELIVTKNECLAKQGAAGLTALAKHLRIEMPKYDQNQVSDETVTVHGGNDDTDYITEPTADDDQVTFVSGVNSDDNAKNRLKFSEKILTENSEVFNRMFNSDFKESKNKEVKLSGQSLCGIKYFLDCLEQFSDQKPLRQPIACEIASTSSSTDTRNVEYAITAALEAYDICQIYLLPELAKLIFNMIIYLIDADNILIIFKYSIKNHKQELTELAINYFLTANIASDRKVEIFCNADESDYYKEWNELILDTIVYSCQNLIL